jgi:hypothetical protein
VPQGFRSHDRRPRSAGVLPRSACRPSSGRLLRALSGTAVAALLSGCTGDYKKMSETESPAEILMYRVFGADRGAQYYYDLVRQSHDEEDFGYRCGTEKYLVDRNIDAIQHLGDSRMTRLEGQALVIDLLVEVLVEDRSALARSASATSLTKIGARLPPYEDHPIEDRGERFLGLAQEIGGLYRQGGGGSVPPASRARAQEALRQIGDLEFDDLSMDKKAVKELSGRPYLLDERDPVLRAAIDTALVKRSDALIRSALRAAVEDPEAQVRADAVRGLKTLTDTRSDEAVVARLDREPSWLVRMEILEYLGKVATPRAVAALVPRLDDANASVRHKAQDSLARIAGRDLGIRRRTWEAWARQRYPGIELPGDEPESVAAAPSR